MLLQIYMKHCEKRFLNLYCIQIYICENFNPPFPFPTRDWQPFHKEYRSQNPTDQKEFPIAPYSYILPKTTRKKHILSDNSFVMKGPGTIVCSYSRKEERRGENPDCSQTGYKSTEWVQHIQARHALYVNFLCGGSTCNSHARKWLRCDWK